MAPYVTAASLKEKTQLWLREIAPVNEHRMKLKKSKASLLVIDMQRFFLEPKSPGFTCGGVAILPTVKKLITAFRKAKRPVIFTRHVHHPDGHDAGNLGWWWEGMCVEGTPESEIHEDIAPLPKEEVILKHRYSSFCNTDLEVVLRGLGIEDIVISGVMTNLCCETTAREAFMRDWRVFFPADATGTVSEEMHCASLLNLAYGFAFVTTADKMIRDLRT
jgi:nicotinamidase-related amidase